MRNMLIAVVIVICFSSVTAYAKPVAIDGTWVSNYMTVIINVDQGIYEGVDRGKQFSRKITLLKHYANVFILDSLEGKITIQIRDDGEIMLTEEGESYEVLERFKD